MSQDFLKAGVDRSKIFVPHLRVDRQKDYNVREYETIPVLFKNGGERNLYKNFNMTIFIDELCNADCKFCISLLRYEHKNEIYEKQKIKNHEEYYRRLRKVLDIVAPLQPSISITGGEPTISPRIIEIAKILDEYDIRKRVVTSNSTGLFRKFNGEFVIDALIENNFDHINISRSHYDDALNREVMQYKAKNYTSLNHIEKVLTVLNDSPISHRLSCVLLQEGVKNLDDIKKYVDVLSSVGGNNFIFREMMDFDKNSVNKPMMEYMDANKVRLNDVWKEFDNDSEMEAVMNILGYYYYVEIYKYKNFTVTSESANLNQQYVEKDTNPDMVYEMIFHENGNLNGSWIESEDILDKYDDFKD